MQLIWMQDSLKNGKPVLDTEKPDEKLRNRKWLGIKITNGMTKASNSELVEIELEQVGTVLQICDGIALIYGLSKVESGELIEFETGLQGIVLNLEEDNVGALLLGPSDNIKEGSTCKRTGRIASLKVGEGMLGRVVDTLGNPIDGKGPILQELLTKCH